MSITKPCSEKSPCDMHYATLTTDNNNNNNNNIITVPQDETFLLVPRQASNQRRSTSWGVNINYFAPWSNQLGNQGRKTILALTKQEMWNPW